MAKDIIGDLGKDFVRPIAREVDALQEKLPEIVEWDANLRAKVFKEALIKDGSMKPREWSEIKTTQSGTFEVQIIMPDSSVVSVTKFSLTVEEEKVGVISLRTSVGQRNIHISIEEI